jgi:5-methylcytosine-specific restriction enzyme A
LPHALRPCAEPRCPELVPRGRCTEHTRKLERPTEKLRPTAAARGYGSRWQKLRDRFLRKNPICVMCKATKRITAANTVDHIIPHRGDPVLMWDENNLQALCTTHHNVKTDTEDGGFGNVRAAV